MRTIHEVQQKSGFKNLLLEKKLMALADTLEKKVWPALLSDLDVRRVLQYIWLPSSGPKPWRIIRIYKGWQSLSTRLYFHPPCALANVLVITHYLLGLSYVYSVLLNFYFFVSQEAQLNEVLSASNLDPSALTMVTRKLEVSTT